MSFLADSTKKEQFSFAFLHAIATNANLTISPTRVDHDSIDCIISARGLIGGIESPFLSVQLKATSRKLIRGKYLHFPLSVKNYNELRSPAASKQVPRILIVLTLPPDPDPWLGQRPHELILRRCAYWRSLVGEPTTTNKYKVMVKIPTKKRLTTRSLTAIMNRVGNGIPL